MSFDAAVALVIIVVLFGTLGALIWWARGASPYDDGMGAGFVDYVPEPPAAAQMAGEDAPDTAAGGSPTGDPPTGDPPKG